MKRYYIGVDWGDRLHQVYVGDDAGKKVREMKVPETVEGLAEIGRWLDEQRAEGFELWAAIEKPAGRIVDFLLDHGVEVYPVNPKAVDRVRDRYRMSGSKSDAFDAYVLAEFVRTDQSHLKSLRPSSEKAQELKMLSRDQRRVGRHKSRLLNQLTTTLKEYYARPLEVFGTWRPRLLWTFSNSIRPRLISVHLNVKSSIALPPSNIISVNSAVRRCGKSLTNRNLLSPSMWSELRRSWSRSSSSSLGFDQSGEDL